MKLSAAKTVAAAALVGSLFLAAAAAAAAAAASPSRHLRIHLDNEKELEAVRVTPLSIPGSIWPSHNHYHYQHDNLLVRKLQGGITTCADFAAYIGMDACDCSALNPSTFTGSILCFTNLEGGFYMTTTFVYSSQSDYVVSNAFYLTQNDMVPLFSYDSSFQGAIIDSCAATINTCQCDCQVGLCSNVINVAESTIVSITCPTVPALDTCAGDVGDLAQYAVQVNQCLGPILGSMAPSNYGSEGGTMDASLDGSEAGTMDPSLDSSEGGTLVGTEVGTQAGTEAGTEAVIDASVRRDNDPF